jgi:hypothetical protein
VLAIALIVWLIANLLHAAPLRFVAGLALAGLLPGLAILRPLGLHRRPAPWVLFAAGALSLPAIAAVVTALALRGVGIDAAVTATMAIAALIVGWPERRDADAAAPPASSDERAALALGVLLCGIIALGLTNPFVAHWSDSWFHAAVYQEVARAGVPPGFPHFAGEALPYPWFFHVALVSLRHLVIDDPFLLIAGVNLWSALLWCLAIVALARAIGLGVGAARWAAVAALVGVNPLGPAFLILRALVGRTRGLSDFTQALSTTNGALNGLAWGFPFFDDSLLGRLWTPTAFNFALVLAALVLVAVFDVWGRVTGRGLALLLVSLALLAHWHTLTALDLLSGVGLGLLAAVVMTRDSRRDALRRVIAIGIVALLAGSLARPYISMITLRNPGVSMMELRVSMPNLLALTIAMGPIALAALAGLGAVPIERRPLVVGMWVGLAFVLLVFDLPGVAEEKLFYPLFLTVAAVAGAGLARFAGDARARARLAVWALVALGALNAVFTATGFLRDRRSLRWMVDAAAAPGVPLYTADESKALAWIRERSPRDAVFLETPRPQGTEPILVHGHRRLFLGRADLFYQATFFSRPGHPPAPPAIWNELEHRAAIQDSVLSNRALTTDERRALEAYPWPLFIWDAGPRPGLAARGNVAFDSPTVRIIALPR